MPPPRWAERASRVDSARYVPARGVSADRRVLLDFRRLGPSEGVAGGVAEVEGGETQLGHPRLRDTGVALPGLPGVVTGERTQDGEVMPADLADVPPRIDRLPSTPGPHDGDVEGAVGGTAEAREPAGEVLDGPPQHPGIVAKLAHPGVAVPAENSPHGPGHVIMVDGHWRRRFADGADTTLSRDQPLDIPFADAVALHQAVVTSAPALTSSCPRPWSRLEHRGQAALKVVDRASHDPGIVLELAQPAVAAEAEQPPDVA